mgnify:CR=1 FL=1
MFTQFHAVMKYPVLGALPLLLIGWWLSAAKPAPTADKMRWYTMEEVIAIKSANPDDDKAIFIDVYTDWCGWCKRMDATTFRDKDVQAILQEEYYAVKFDAEQKEAIEMGERTYQFVAQGRRGYHELAAELLQGRMSYPSCVFLDQDMNLIQPVPGYRKADEMLPILHFFGKEVYQRQAWPQFYQEWQASH